MIHIRATWSGDAGDKRQLPREVWEGVGGGAVGSPSQVAPTFKSFLALCALASSAYLGVAGCPTQITSISRKRTDVDVRSP